MKRKQGSSDAAPDGDETSENRQSRLATWLEWVRAELDSNLDTDLAILLGAIVGVLGILQITSLETTVGLVLVALAAVAGSLRADRSLREQLEGAVNRLDEKLVLVSRALSSPLPYEVVSGHYKWDFKPGGKVAKVSKKARIRFVHNGVWTILQWHSNGVDVREPKAHRLTEQGHKQALSVLQGPTDPPLQRVGKLVAFDRECGLDDVLDFEYGYESYGNFDAAQEWLNTDIETSTADITIELAWADDRQPETIWREVDGGRMPLAVEQAGERHRTRVKLRHLSRGQRVCVRWEWAPVEALENDR